MLEAAMRKILYTLRYGDGRTKAFLIGIISSLFLAIVCGALCFVSNPLIFGGAAFALAIVAAVLVVKAGFTSVDGDTDSADAGPAGPGAKARQGADEQPARPAQRPAEAVDVGPKKQSAKEGPEALPGRPENVPDEPVRREPLEAVTDADPEIQSRPVREVPADVPDAPPAADRPAGKSDTDKESKKEKTSKKRDEMPEDEPEEEPEGRKRPAKQKKAVEEETEDDEDDESSVTYLKQYTQKNMTKLFKTVRVKGDPTAILIDLCESERIRQCPAYVWQAKGQICFLLLEKSPRTVSFAASEVLDVTNRPGVSASPKQDYQNLSDLEELKDEFERLMPATFSEGMAGRYSFKKNLYVLGHDIAITPMSLRAMLPKFEFRFKLKDKLLADKSFSDYFKEAYKWKLLWNDGVLTVKEYQERIRHSLSLMALDKKVIDYDFEKNLSQMIHYRLITDEYADYFRARRAEKK